MNGGDDGARGGLADVCTAHLMPELGVAIQPRALQRDELAHLPRSDPSMRDNDGGRGKSQEGRQFLSPGGPRCCAVAAIGRVQEAVHEERVIVPPRHPLPPVPPGPFWPATDLACEREAKRCGPRPPWADGILYAERVHEAGPGEETGTRHEVHDGLELGEVNRYVLSGTCSRNSFPPAEKDHLRMVCAVPDEVFHLRERHLEILDPAPLPGPRRSRRARRCSARRTASPAGQTTPLACASSRRTPPHIALRRVAPGAVRGMGLAAHERCTVSKKLRCSGRFRPGVAVAWARSRGYGATPCG